MFIKDTYFRAEYLSEGDIFLYDGVYQIVHSTCRIGDFVEIRMNAVDKIGSTTRIETIELPRDLFVVTFKFPNK